jgi:hypothetical protein
MSRPGVRTERFNSPLKNKTTPKGFPSRRSSIFFAVGEGVWRAPTRYLLMPSELRHA